MIAIEPQGTGVLLPAFVVGFEVPAEEPHDRVSSWRSSPDWIVVVDQQAGGMCMRYPVVAGVVLRFADNRDRFQREPDFVIRGFGAMAEDPQLDVLERDYSVLRGLVGTHGSDYNPQELRSLEAFLTRYVEVPAMESGFEAFIRFSACDILRYFAGWRLLLVEVLPPYREAYGDVHCPRVEDGELGRFAFRNDAMLNEEKVAGLRRLGELLGQSEARAFLLWENCD